VSHDKNERSTLRRLIQRWKKEAEYMAKSPAIINDELVTRIDKHEIYGGLPKYDDD